MPKLHRRAHGRTVADQVHGRLALVVEQRAARNAQHVVALLVLDPEAAEHARLQGLPAFERGNDPESAAARVHHRRHAVHAAFEAAPRQRIDLHLYRLAGLERGQLALGHVEGGLQPRVVDDAHDRGVDLHEVAGLDRARSDHAGDRRGDRGVGKLQARQVVGRARVLQVVAHLVVLAGADQLLRGELLGALVVALELAHLRFDLGHVQAGPVRVQPYQRLPRLDHLALFHQHLQGHARGLGHHLRFGQRFQRGGAGVAGGDGAVAGLGHFHRDRVHLFRLSGLGAVPGAPASGQGHQAAGKDKQGPSGMAAHGMHAHVSDSVWCCSQVNHR